MSEPSEDRDPLEVLAAEFMDRQRRGESPSIAEYTARHPELAAEIRDLFPAIAVVERLKSHREEASGARVSLGTPRLERLGDFRILGEIGRGGMGIVYEAFQESLGRHVAVKVLPRQPFLDPRRLQRFQRESQTAARLHHTNIVPVFGVGEHDGFHYIVMQLIRGVGLDLILGKLQEASDSGEPTPPGQDSVLPVPETERTREVARLAKALLEGKPWQMPEPEFSLGDSDPAAFGPRQQPPTASPDSTRAGSGTEAFTNDRETKVHGHSDTQPQPLPKSQSAQFETAELGPSYWRSIATIGLQVAEALHYAHTHRTLHRDVKPANLLLDSQGVVWITDFGLAKAMEQDNVTQSGVLVGTLRYMAPEQFSGQVDARSDICSLGLTLYELLTLRPAFDDTSRGSLIRKITHEEPLRPRKLNPRIPRDLETIVLKAIACEPAHRYQSAGELARDLECFLEDRPIQARRTHAVERLWRWARRNRAVAGLAASTLLLLVLVAVVASVGYVRTTRANLDEAAQRKKAEATSALALEALDNIFRQFAPDRAVTPSELTVVSQAGEEIAVPVQPVLSKEAAALLEHMLVFYDRLAKQGGDDAKLRRKVAEANRRVGDIRQRLGNLDQAKASYLRAIDLCAEVAKTSPNDADLAIEIAQARNRLGDVYGALDDPQAQRASHAQALATLMAVTSGASASPRYRYELARTYYLMGKGPGPMLSPLPPGPPGPGGRRGGRGGPSGPDGRSPGPPDAEMSPHPDGEEHHEPGPRGPKPFDRTAGPTNEDHGPPRPDARPRGPFMDRKEQEDNLRKAVNLLETLVAEHPAVPDYRHLLARCYRELSAGPPRPGAWSSPETASKATEILRKLVADFPDVADYRYDLSETLAQVDMRFFPGPRDPTAGEDRQEAMEAAQQRLREALKISEQLVAEHPNVPDYAASQVHILLSLSGVLRQAKQLADAEESLRKAKSLQAGLVRRYPQTVSYRVSLAIVQGSLADVLGKVDKLPEARTLLEASAQLLEEAVQKEPNLGHLRGILGFHYMGLADLLRKMGDTQAAAAVQAKADQLRPAR
ncbi:MAG: protein kinase domain-containing protein [Pirellulales bacterium]